MSDADTIERLNKAEERIRGIEELAFAFSDTLNTRTGRYDAEFNEIRSRLGLIDRAITMLQNDVRDLRSGVTSQLKLQDRTIAELVVKIEAQAQQLDAQAQQLDAVAQQLGTQAQQLDAVAQHLDRQSQQLSKFDSKLDAIIAKLGA